MIITNKSIEKISLSKLMCLIFIPTSILTIVYIIIGFMQNTIPSRLLFSLCGTFILVPIELGIVMYSSKKEYGSYSLKSSFTRYSKMSWWKIFLYGSFLFAFAGIMSLTIAPMVNIMSANNVAKKTPSGGIYTFTRRVEPNQTLTKHDFQGMYIIPPGSSFALFFLSPGKEYMQSRLAFGWWEDRVDRGCRY